MSKGKTIGKVLIPSDHECVKGCKPGDQFHILARVPEMASDADGDESLPIGEKGHVMMHPTEVTKHVPVPKRKTSPMEYLKSKIK